MTLLHAFSRAWRRLHESPRDLDWFIWLSRLILIGHVVALALVCRIKSSVKCNFNFVLTALMEL